MRHLNLRQRWSSSLGLLPPRPHQRCLCPQAVWFRVCTGPYMMLLLLAAVSSTSSAAHVTSSCDMQATSATAHARMSSQVMAWSVSGGQAQRKQAVGCWACFAVRMPSTASAQWHAAGSLTRCTSCHMVAGSVARGSRASRGGQTDPGCRAQRVCKPGMLAERAAHDQVMLGDTAGHLRVWKPAAAAEGRSHTEQRPLFTQACIWRAHERAVTSVQHVTMAGGLLLTASLARFHCSAHRLSSGASSTAEDITIFWLNRT